LLFRWATCRDAYNSHMTLVNQNTRAQPVSCDQIIINSFQESLVLHQALLGDPQLLSAVAKVGQEFVEALQRGRKIFLFGNGGSAADAQHLAAELVGRFECERRALPAIALTTDTSTLTAISNDYSYESVFARQLEGLGSAGDVAVGISTSGKSRNVLSAVRKARAMGLVTVGMTGLWGGELPGAVDYCICVPSERTARIQEAHILIGHVVCKIVEEMLVSDQGSGQGMARMKGPKNRAAVLL